MGAAPPNVPRDLGQVTTERGKSCSGVIMQRFRLTAVFRSFHGKAGWRQLACGENCLLCGQDGEHYAIWHTKAHHPLVPQI